MWVPPTSRCAVDIAFVPKKQIQVQRLLHLVGNVYPTRGESSAPKLVIDQVDGVVWSPARREQPSEPFHIVLNEIAWLIIYQEVH